MANVALGRMVYTHDTHGRTIEVGGVNGNPLQYSCLENLLHRGAWRAAVPGVAESQKQFIGPLVERLPW